MIPIVVAWSIDIVSCGGVDLVTCVGVGVWLRPGWWCGGVVGLVWVWVVGVGVVDWRWLSCSRG